MFTPLTQTSVRRRAPTPAMPRRAPAGRPARRERRRSVGRSRSFRMLISSSPFRARRDGRCARFHRAMPIGFMRLDLAFPCPSLHARIPGAADSVHAQPARPEPVFQKRPTAPEFDQRPTPPADLTRPCAAVYVVTRGVDNLPQRLTIDTFPAANLPACAPPLALEFIRRKVATAAGTEYSSVGQINDDARLVYVNHRRQTDVGHRPLLARRRVKRHNQFV